MSSDRQQSIPNHSAYGKALSVKTVPAVVLIISLITTVGMWHMLNKGIYQKAEQVFNEKVVTITTALDQRLHEHEQVLKGGIGIFNANGDVTRDQWRRYVASLQLDQNHPGILGVGYSAWLKPEEKEDNIRKIRAEGFPEYTIKPPGERPVYTSIIYLEPFTWRNERAFGYDMFSEATRRAAMEKARDEGVTTIASRIILVQETEKDKQIGLLMYLPLYHQGLPVETPAQRQAAIKGFVYSPIRMKDFVYGTLGKLPKDIAFEIYNGDTVKADNLMFSSLYSEKITLPEGYEPRLTKSVKVVALGRPWTIVFQSLPSFNREFNRTVSLLCLAGAVLVSLLLTYIAFTLLTTRNRALELARTMTQELRGSEAKTRLILDTVGEAIYGIDVNGCCTFCNPACLRILGYHTQDELLGKDMHNLIHHSLGGGEPLPVSECRIYSSLHAKSSCHLEDEIFWRRNGVSFPVECWAVPQIEDGQLVGAVVTFIDITSRKQTETMMREQAELLQQEVAQRTKAQEQLLCNQEELEELNRGLEQRVALEVGKNRDKDQVLMQSEKMASVGQLAAGVAHEINNPMGFISSNLRILTEYFDQVVRFDQVLLEQGLPELPPPVRESILAARESLEIQQIMEDGSDLIRESLGGAVRVTKIVQDLKSFSRVDALEQEAVQVASCLDSALNICYNELKYAASIRKDYAPEMPLVFCHPGQLNQVFLNLLVNAGQAVTPPGEIVLKVWHNEGFVYASVSDNGKGIPENIRGRIFEPFFTTKDVGQGTGLGLSVSSEIIKKHDGEILVESEVGAGTTFTVKLPSHQEPPA